MKNIVLFVILISVAASGYSTLNDGTSADDRPSKFVASELSKGVRIVGPYTFKWSPDDDGANITIQFGNKIVYKMWGGNSQSGHGDYGSVEFLDLFKNKNLYVMVNTGGGRRAGEGTSTLLELLPDGNKNVLFDGESDADYADLDGDGVPELINSSEQMFYEGKAFLFCGYQRIQALTTYRWEVSTHKFEPANYKFSDYVLKQEHATLKVDPIKDSDDERAYSNVWEAIMACYPYWWCGMDDKGWVLFRKIYRFPDHAAVARQIYDSMAKDEYLVRMKQMMKMRSTSAEPLSTPKS